MNLHAQRLLNVARALRESAAPDRFTMAHVLHSCGTPACAFGHYVARTDLQNAFCIAPTSTGGYPAYKGTDNYCVFTETPVREHFGIDLSELKELFYGDGCGNAKTANQAARYIEGFVARKYSAEQTPVVVPDWNAMASQRTVSDAAVDEMVRA